MIPILILWTLACVAYAIYVRRFCKKKIQQLDQIKQINQY